MNKLLKAILIIHPFTQYIFFRLEPQISRVLALTGIIAVLAIYLCSLTEEKRKVVIPWLWPYILVQSIFLGLPSYCIHISIFFLLYTTISQMEIDWEDVLYPLGYVCVAMSLLSILQVLGIRQFKYSWSAHPGLLGNSTDSAMYIAAISPFLLLHKKGWLYFIIPIIAIWMLNSASALLGIASVALLYLIIKRYYWKLIALVMAIFAGLCFWSDRLIEFFDPHTKFEIWARAMTDWKDFAWFGRGLGNFYGRYRIGESICAMQNHYLYILYVLGIFGMGFLLWWLIPHFRNTRAILPYVSVVAVCMMATCSDPMKVYPIAILTGINLGILAHKRSFHYD